MRTVATSLAALAVLAGAAEAAQAPQTPAGYSRAVVQICAGALLFDKPHQMGTRSDALSIADDIRASTARRLDLVTAVSVPPELQDISARWIDSQRRLAALYATTWVRIYDTIDAAHTSAQRTTLAKRLEKLVHAPDPLKRAAGLLELELPIPYCTGGGLCPDYSKCPSVDAGRRCRTMRRCDSPFALHWTRSRHPRRLTKRQLE